MTETEMVEDTQLLEIDLSSLSISTSKHSSICRHIRTLNIASARKKIPSLTISHGQQLCLVCCIILSLSDILQHVKSSNHFLYMECDRLFAWCWECKEKLLTTSKQKLIDEVRNMLKKKLIEPSMSSKNYKKTGEMESKCKTQQLATQESMMDVKPFGLLNLGNTCFMNSVLQSLRTVFPSNILSSELKIDDHLTLELLALFSKNPSTKTISPREFLDQISKIYKEYRKRNQQDSHEFLTRLLDHLSMKLISDPTLSSSFKSTFYGEMLTNLQCFKCRCTTVIKEPFNNISLSLNAESISACLADFCDVEELTDEDSVFCEKCKQKCDFKKRISLNVLPNVLILHLKRFFGDSNEKNTKEIAIPVKFVWNDEEFELMAGIEHIGFSVRSGHYVAYVQRNENWWYCSDSTIRAIKDCPDFEPYILFYQKIHKTS